MDGVRTTLNAASYGGRNNKDLMTLLIIYSTQRWW